MQLCVAYVSIGFVSISPDFNKLVFLFSHDSWHLRHRWDLQRGVHSGTEVLRGIGMHLVRQEVSGHLLSRFGSQSQRHERRRLDSGRAAVQEKGIFADLHHYKQFDS